MPLFKVQNGKIDQLQENSDLSSDDLEVLSEQLIVMGDVLPEKLLIIGDWSPIPDENGQMVGFTALDVDCSLVYIALCSGTPSTVLIREASETAWDSRFLSYDDLNIRAQTHFAAHGIDEKNLFDIHSRFFDYTGHYTPGSFNEDQRVIFIAPFYDSNALNALQWHRLEHDIDAYQISFIDLDSKDKKQLVAIDKLNVLESNRLVSLASLVISSPARLLNNMFSEDTGLSSDESQHSTRFQAVFNESYPLSMEYGVISALITVYVIVFSYLSIINHNNFGTFGFDLGIFDQGVWLLSKFKDPFITIRGLPLFGDHLSFILLLVAPLYWIWADPKLLLVLQTIVLAAGAVPVYLIAKDRLKNSPLSLVFAASYLLYPALEWINWDQFHPDAFSTTFLLFALLFVFRKRYIPFAVFAFLALIVKEDVALILFLLGIYIAVSQNRKVGIITSGAAAAWFIVGYSLILPHFNGIGFFNIRNYSNLGSSPLQIAINALLHPGSILTTITRETKLVYIVQLLVPVAFLPMAGLEIFILALPTLFSNLVSQQGYMDSIQYHYSATIIPFVFVASIVAIEKIADNAQARALSAAGLLVFALATNYLYSPSPLSTSSRLGTWALVNNRASTIREALQLIPEKADVSAQYNIAPHLAHRLKIYEFPNPFKAENWGVNNKNSDNPRDIEYIVVDRTRLSNEQRLLLISLRNKDFKQTFNKDEIIVLKRRER